MIKYISRKWKQLNAENTYVAHSSRVQLIRREIKSTELWSSRKHCIHIQEAEKDKWIHVGAEFTIFIYTHKYLLVPKIVPTTVNFVLPISFTLMKIMPKKHIYMFRSHECLTRLSIPLLWLDHFRSSCSPSPSWQCLSFISIGLCILKAPSTNSSFHTINKDKGL